MHHRLAVVLHRADQLAVQQIPVVDLAIFAATDDRRIGSVKRAVDSVLLRRMTSVPGEKKENLITWHPQKPTPLT